MPMRSCGILAYICVGSFITLHTPSYFHYARRWHTTRIKRSRRHQKMMMSNLKSASLRAASSIANGSSNSSRKRRLIVDTDLGLDDLVALAMLRVQQSLHHRQVESSHHHHHHYTPFELSGVTITSGVSCANAENAALLRRLLPPDTPVYVSESGAGADTALSWMGEDKPIWWTRTAQRVAHFLSLLPPLSATQQQQQSDQIEQQKDMSAEEFIANNMDDPNVDFLCMAPLTSVGGAVQLRSQRQQRKSTSNSTSQPKANFYIMGGIREDSKVTKRGESTAPFGYYDVVGEANDDDDDASETTMDRFGEFNFALDVAAAGTALSAVAARIIPLEACTLVPRALRPKSATATATLSSVLASSREDARSFTADDAGELTTESAEELLAARSVLLKLLRDHGTAETQWDSISAAIYCNAFGTACADDSDNNCALTHIESGRLDLSELGALSFPGCQSGEAEDANASNDIDDDGHHDEHLMYPAFLIEDETTFFEYLSFLLYSDSSESR